VSNGLKPIQAIGNQLESGLIKLASVKRQQCGLCRPSVPSTLFSLRHDMNWNFVPLIAIIQWQQLFSNRFIIR
jgi:hypothetical protein